MRNKRGFGERMAGRVQTVVFTVVAAVLLVIMLAAAFIYWLISLASGVPEEEKVWEEAKVEMWGED